MFYIFSVWFFQLEHKLHETKSLASSPLMLLQNLRVHNTWKILNRQLLTKWRNEDVWALWRLFWHLLPHFDILASFHSSLSPGVQSRGFSSPNSCVVPLSLWASLMTQMVKKLPAVPETQVQSLGQEDPQEKGMATHSCILAWRIPWKEEPGWLQSKWSQRVR